MRAYAIDVPAETIPVPIDSPHFGRFFDMLVDWVQQFTEVKKILSEANKSWIHFFFSQMWLLQNGE